MIDLNADEATASTNSAYGANVNQIAAAKIMKVWLMNIITDTWGNVPYSEISQLEDGVLYCKYDSQKDIYDGMIAELTEAVNMIDESEPAFTSGDVIYGGDASKWKKFGNSLKCRLAIHLSEYLAGPLCGLFLQHSRHISEVFCFLSLLIIREPSFRNSGELYL